MIDIPDELYTFGTWLHQDSMELYGPTIEQMLAGALSHIKPERRHVLRNFIDRLLTGKYSETELKQVYRMADVDFSPRGEDGHRKIFTLMRATLDADCKPYYGPL